MIFFSYNTEVMPKVRLMGRAKYNEPWKHFNRRSDEYILYIIREGEMYLCENGFNFHLKAGDFFVLEPNLFHQGYLEAPCDYYYIHLKAPAMYRKDMEEKEILNELQEKRRKSMSSYNLDEAEIIDPYTYLPKRYNFFDKTYRQDFHDMIEIYNLREEHYKRVTSAKLHCFLLKLAHEYFVNQIETKGKSGIRRSELIIENLILYINENYTKKHKSGDFEMIYEMNFDYLNRVFQKITGRTIFAYINAVRMNNAKQLIETTNLSFSEISYLVGINDKYYFSRIFKKTVGSTPTEYYKKHHKNEEV